MSQDLKVMSNKMVSLYDYLGRAAGKTLGGSVAKYAYSQKTKISKREVSNPVYSGPVNLYTEDFLTSYFNNPNYRTIIKQDEKQYKQSLERKVSDTEDNTLPF